MRAVWFAIAACASAPAPVQSTTCPAPSEVERTLSQPVALEINVLDDFLWGDCTKVPQRVVRVGIDRRPWCSVTMQCTNLMQAPPRSFACKGPPVAPGARTLEVQIDGIAAADMFRTMSLPAFDRTPDGAFTFGAHVSIWVAEDKILIDPPLATQSLMM